MKEPFIEACRNGNVEAVKEALRKGIHVNESEFRGSTPLMAACRGRHWEVVKVLVEAGAVHGWVLATHGEEGPLSFVEHENLSLVTFLLSHQIGASRQEAQNILKWTKKRVPEALKNGLWNNNEEGAAVMLLACITGDNALIRELLASGIKVSSYMLSRALEVSVIYGKGNSLKAITSSTSAVTNAMISQAIKLATARNDFALVDILLAARPKRHGKHKQKKITKSVPPGLLINACEAGNVGEVKKFIGYGANVNEMDYYSGISPLIGACMAGNVEIVKILLEAGADVNMRNSSKASALMWACDKGNEEIVKLLLAAKANVNVTDKYGRWVLLWAKKPAIIKLLLEAGVNPNKRNQFGKTPLMEAEKMGDWFLIEQLKSYGAKE